MGTQLLNIIIVVVVLIIAVRFMLRPFLGDRARNAGCIFPFPRQLIPLLLILGLSWYLLSNLKTIKFPGSKGDTAQQGNQEQRPPTTPTANKYFWPVRDKNGNKVGEYGPLTFLTNTCMNRNSQNRCTLYARHLGVDILVYEEGAKWKGPQEGSLIYPISDGKVVDKNCGVENGTYNSGLGYSILIEHNIMQKGKKLYSMYLHLQECPLPNINDTVNGGETLLGHIGKTGFSFGQATPHLHLETPLFQGWGHPENKLSGVIRYCYGYRYDENPGLYTDNWVDPDSLIR